jgi:ABC-type sugar transport system permease subunit
MGIGINIALLLLLGITIYQDFRYRGIWWGIIPALLVVLIWRGLYTENIETLTTLFFKNGTFLLMQWLGITLYYSAKERRLVNVIDRYIGIGDLLFFVALSIAFSQFNFVAFMVVGFMLTILGYGFYHLLSRKAEKSIPLAGTMSILLIALLCIDAADWYNDTLITSMLFHE